MRKLNSRVMGKGISRGYAAELGEEEKKLPRCKGDKFANS